MIETIKTSIFKKYKKDDIKGLFFSVFNEQGELLMSNGVVYTDKVLEELIDLLYQGLIKKHTNIGSIVADVVLETVELKTPQEIQTISPKDFGIVLSDGSKSGVLLPNTKGVNNIQEGLKLIKEKNDLGNNVQVVKFKTDRFII
ncbi:MAG TPA: hypothetical protein PK674_03490 [Candidatus Absconditabacterales bacterium]|nr:hypothetical protein [Candidatus Absconditabacterales bacterium]HOG15625.1 hypothetical protein [Candidatus Absconditabacterales bacterium]HOQ79314.1 hypothetical protein [Candidatus Absconditabacterales bacterium]HPK28357.1 hypothetical protein [Candidatus Absconditabacterales bacterium]